MIISDCPNGKRLMLGLSAALALLGLTAPALLPPPDPRTALNLPFLLSVSLHGGAFASACVAALFMESSARVKDRAARRESEQRLNALIQAIPNEVCFQDASGRWLVINQAMQDAVGLEASALAGKTVTEIMAVSPNIGFINSTVVETDEMAWKVGEVRYCVSFRRPDGQNSTLEVQKKTLEHDGRTVGLMVLRQDITSSRRAMEELRTLHDSLEVRVNLATEENRRKDILLMQQARLAAMGEMIGNIAHQWRQPLNALGLLMANLTYDAKSGTASNEEIDAYTRQGREVLTSMSRTIDDFRNFFKPDKQKQTFQVCDAIQEALSLMEASFTQAGIAVERDLEHPLEILGYRGEFSQVILNLLANARDAIKDSGNRRGVIRVSTAREDGVARVMVADNGGGIAQQDLSRIFDPYFTTKSQDKGTGLGLYMSKRIIEDHMQGDIAAFNADAGAVFTLSVPLMPAETAREDVHPCR